MLVFLFDSVEFSEDIRELVKVFYKNEEVSYEDKEEFKVKLQVLKEDETYNISIFFNSSKIAFSKYNIKEKLDRLELKNEIKRKIYESLSKYLDLTLPWGTLTGIRPTKLITKMLEDNINIEDIKKEMQEKYLISDKKFSLCLSTALKEQEILRKLDYKNTFSLYVNIPFCPSICAYCSFSSYPISRYKTLVYEYLLALKKELEAVSYLVKDKKLSSIYIGGGTPSSLSEEEVDLLLTFIREYFSFDSLEEFSFEAGRVDSITFKKLEILKKHGITRISLNPQTFNDETLKIIGRSQTKEEFLEIYQMARDLSFSNINTDIILGLPNEDILDVKNTMKELIYLSPESITVHSLAIKRAARLNTNKAEFDILNFKNTEKMIDLAFSSCEDMGLFPYYLYRQKNMIGNFENVGFAKEGKECIYNILIMEEKQDIYAVGAGATSKLIFENSLIKRIENVKDPSLYIKRIDEMIQKKKIEV